VNNRASASAVGVKTTCNLHHLYPVQEKHAAPPDKPSSNDLCTRSDFSRIVAAELHYNLPPRRQPLIRTSEHCTLQDCKGASVYSSVYGLRRSSLNSETGQRILMDYCNIKSKNGLIEQAACNNTRWCNYMNILTGTSE